MLLWLQTVNLGTASVQQSRRESHLERMEKAAKAVFELPPLDDQAEWEAGMLAELEGADKDSDVEDNQRTVGGRRGVTGGKGITKSK